MPDDVLQELYLIIANRLRINWEKVLKEEKDGDVE